MATIIITREERGREIAEKPNQIMRLDERHYRVASQSLNGGMYDVIKTDKFAIGWICNCPDFTYRQAKCKHMWAVEFSVAIRNEVERHIIEPLNITVCAYCGANNSLVRHGLRHNKYGDLQRFSCKTCGKRFTQNIGFEGLTAPAQAVTSAMQLYFTGESLRNVQKLLQLRGVNVSYVTVYRWIRKYVGLMEKYLEQIKPQVSNTWRADELYFKVQGNMKYLYALMDDQTRFWISQEVADKKYTADVTPLFRDGKARAGKTPTIIITDGAPNFNSAIRHAYWRKTKHWR